jgi:predicted GNAT superfamily acetyltransferase
VIEVRELTEPDEHRAAVVLFEHIWSVQPLEPELLTAFAHSGNYVAGIYVDDQLAGAAVGFFDAHGGLHSHIAGVLPRHQGRGLGLALKMHQRDWALERSITTIRWTYDPLVRRNAYFNITRLGARPAEYLPDFYGSMTDGINVGDHSDRFLVEWHLTEPVGDEPDVDELRTSGAVALLQQGSDGEPLSDPDTSLDAPALLVQVPQDVESLRRDDPPLAARWRTESRKALLHALDAGFAVTGMSRSGWYVLTDGGPK